MNSMKTIFYVTTVISTICKKEEKQVQAKLKTQLFFCKKTVPKPLN